MQKQIEDIWTQVGSFKDEVSAKLETVDGFDKEIKLLKAQYKQIDKTTAAKCDKIGEYVFALEDNLTELKV